MEKIIKTTLTTKKNATKPENSIQSKKKIGVDFVDISVSAMEIKST